MSKKKEMQCFKEAGHVSYIYEWIPNLAPHLSLCSRKGGRQKEVVKGVVATCWQQEKIIDDAFPNVIGG